MTHPKDSDVETIPDVVSSDESGKKDMKGDRIHEDRIQRRTNRGIDPVLCPPPTETGVSVSGDMPNPHQSAPFGAVKEVNITLKQGEQGSEPSSGTDNGDEDDVKRLDEALSRLVVKDVDDPEGLPHSSLVSSTRRSVPGTDSSDTSLDAVSDACGAKGRERLSESSLESDGNVSDDESDIDSDGIGSTNESSPPRDNREQLVERGPRRGHTSQPRHQGTPYERQPAITKEQDDDLKMLIEMSPHSYCGSQHSSPQGASDRNYVDDDWLNNLETSPTPPLQLFDGNDLGVSEQFLTGDVACSGQAGLECAGNIDNSPEASQQYANEINSFTAAPTPPSMTTTPSASNLAQSYIVPPSTAANISQLEYSVYMSGSQAPMQYTIPSVVHEKINESETDTKKKRTRTPRAKKGTPTQRKATAKSKGPSSVQQTPPPIQPLLNQSLVSQTPIDSSSVLMEDAMSLIANELCNNQLDGTHESDIQTASEQMPSHPGQPVQQFPVPGTLFPQSLIQAPQQLASPIYLRTEPIEVERVAAIAVQSSPQHNFACNFDVQHVASNVQVLGQQPPLTSTQMKSHGTGQPQMHSYMTQMMPHAGVRQLVPSSAQYKMTTAGILGASSHQLFASPFQTVMPRQYPNGNQTGSTLISSRFQKIVPKPT